MTALSAPRRDALRRVFGDVLPKDAGAAIRMLEDSPAAPVSQAERLALREACVAFAGARVEAIRVEGRSGVAVRSRSLAARAAAPADGLRRVVSEREARALFSDAAAMADVPWGFLEEGCIHRAHVLAKRLEERGFHSEKIFAIPKEGEDLIIETARARLGYTVVWFHTAVALTVQPDDGPRRRVVIDPSVADRPLSVDAWQATMHGAKGGALDTFYLPRFAYGLSERDAPPSAWIEKDLDAAFSWGDEWKLVEEDYLKTGFYDEVARLAGRAPQGTKSAPT